jgi:hypothetical protein
VPGEGRVAETACAAPRVTQSCLRNSVFFEILEESHLEKNG